MTAIDEKFVWAWGSNNCGQLGCGDCDDRLTPTTVESFFSNATLSATTLRRDKFNSEAPLSSQENIEEFSTITYFGGGGAFSVVLTDSGHVFTCGKNDRGQLGQGTDRTQNKSAVDLQFSLCALANTLTVKHLQAGWDFVVALTECGSIFTWGSNSFGQLGRSLAAGVKMDPTPQAVDSPSSGTGKFVAVAAGLRHALAVSESGQIYSWGSGKRGQLGVVDSLGKPISTIPVPNCVSISKCSAPTQIFAGMNFSGMLTETGKIYLWGCNKHGQCGEAPPSQTMYPLPRCLETSQIFSKGSQSKIVSLRVGWTHVIMRTEAGDLYSWGRFDLGQLGRSTEEVPHYVPGHIDGVTNVSKHCCSSEHNLALTDEGQIYSWGWNEHGICGTGDESNVLYPQRISSLQNHQVMCIGCGAGHCFCLTKKAPSS
ncbi:secretion-regulating guanine nucleotide exchange factor [Plakobranchus ocellatus]|uniref:Secretion-regulating guanine nucleotide exchange factor n=1 Tax=Plakobranchus ocellatus TaxID=259542 RepID=A0AAV4A3X3_9GAST|nr:secretion-regulating guanine nucleotide exchange factor [Plakobranchus ocellatus]